MATIVVPPAAVKEATKTPVTKPEATPTVVDATKPAIGGFEISPQDALSRYDYTTDINGNQVDLVGVVRNAKKTICGVEPFSGNCFINANGRRWKEWN